jgi:hypothetical protein
MDANTQAARLFFRMVRDFSESARGHEPALYHEVTPDEQLDLTLASRRIYGRPDEYLAVMAAAGLDTVDQVLPQTRLVLPTADRLRQMKRDSGFESIADYRIDGVPTWAE